MHPIAVYYIVQFSRNKGLNSLLLQVRTAYKKLMIDVAKLLVDRPETESLMTEVYNFEESLAKVRPTSIRS